MSILAGIEGVAAVGAPGVDAGGERRGQPCRRDSCGQSRERRARPEPRGRTVERCTAALVAAGIGVREVRASGGSLEEVFASLTQDAPDAGGRRRRATNARLRGRRAS